MCISALVIRSFVLMQVYCRGAFLTPQEMDELTASWRPYRSIGEAVNFTLIRPMTHALDAGVYYMWALAEEAK